jgi:Ankyrin repeats (3 copies)
MTDLDLLIEAAQHDDLETVQSILDRNQKVVSERDVSGATALHYAAFNGHRRIAKLLVERGADINSRDNKFGATPAGWAIEYLRELGGHLGIELEDLAYAIQNHDSRWVRRFLARFPAMREGIYKNRTTFRRLALESADPTIVELFGDGPG